MSAAIINYGMGNVASVQKALSYLNVENIVTENFNEIDQAKFIILPGVGSYNQGISNLQKNGLFDFLSDQVLKKKKPFLGICLGMQLIATKGTEPFEIAGLNWIGGEVIKMELKEKRVPHLGWNTIIPKETKYFSSLKNLDFYFIHSYHFKVTDEQYISSIVNYGIDMVSSVQKENIFATQFHPEKSQETGLKLLKNFFELNA